MLGIPKISKFVILASLLLAGTCLQAMEVGPDSEKPLQIHQTTTQPEIQGPKEILYDLPLTPDPLVKEDITLSGKTKILPQDSYATISPSDPHYPALKLLSHDLLGALRDFFTDKEPCILAQSDKEYYSRIINTQKTIRANNPAYPYAAYPYDLFFLQHTGKFKGLTTFIVYKAGVTDESLKHLTGLKKLELRNEIKITAEGLKHLTNLTDLSLLFMSKSFYTLPLKNLKKLHLDNVEVSDATLLDLANLTDLSLRNIYTITDEGIKGLTNLTNLHLWDWQRYPKLKINAQGIRQLPKLINLSLCETGEWINIGISTFTNLTSLHLDIGKDITDRDLSPLTALRKLSLHGVLGLTGEAFHLLTNLTSLDFAVTPGVEGGVYFLTNLTHLSFDSTLSPINEQALTNLQKLRKINIADDRKIYIADETKGFTGCYLHLLPSLTHITFCGKPIVESAEGEPLNSSQRDSIKDSLAEARKNTLKR